MKFSALRKRIHLSPTTVIATLALVFAMTGGAYAAKKYLITSTKQISPSVLKSLQGKAGPAGVAGVQGLAGPAGPAGSAGAKGDNGSNGSNGSNGESVTEAEVKTGESLCSKLGGSKFTVGGKETTACNGKEGKAGAAGAQGEPWTAGGTLPEGATETGMWSFDVQSSAGLFVGELASAPISYGIPLKAGETATVVYIAEGASEPTHCPGTAEAPKAEPGYLCVYTNYVNGPKTGLSVYTSILFDKVSGAVLLFEDLAEEEIEQPVGSGTMVKVKEKFANGNFAAGTWAVTAG
jgi:hypothetical protein